MSERRVPVVGAVVVLQAAWLALLTGRGWFSGPDLANISYAVGKPLDGDYLTASLGGHFGAPTRLSYWLLAKVDPLGWGITVGVRVLLQALGTWLLWKLLTELVGPRRWLPLVLVCYAFSPVLVPGFAVLSSGLGLSIGQAALVGMLLLHVRYARTRRIGYAVGVAVLALTALVYADQVAPGMLVLPLLSLGVLSRGSLAARLRAALRLWPEWLLLALAAAGFGALYLSGDYTSAQSTFGPSQAWDLVRTEWVDVLGTSLVGGPWDWTAGADEWTSLAVPPLAAKVLGQVALVGLVVASFRVTGKRALYGWLVPLIVAVGGVLLVGIGRSDYLGTFIAPILRYSHYAPLALALGVTLAFATTPEEEAEERPLALPSGGGPVAAVAVAASLVMCVVSGAGYAQRFWENPAPDYVSTLDRSARATTSQVFDPPVPAGVIPPVEPNNFVSDVLLLTGARARFDGLEPNPLTFDGSGRAVASTFVTATDLTDPTQPGCGVRVTGSTTVHLGPVDANAWYLQLQVVQSRSNAFTIEVRGADGEVLPFRHGSRTVQPTGTLVGINRALSYGTPTTVTLTSPDPQTSFCLVHAYVGAPFPKAGS